jgi:hypothetical protein
MPHSNPSYIAGGNILPSRFVKLEAGENNSVVQCVADDVANAGVSAEGTNTAPIPGASGNAAEAGQSCQVYGLGEPCEVVAGATVAAGDPLKPDADGKAIKAVAGDEYSAVARSAAAANEKIKCVVRYGSLPSA